jgi:hypothetical protein
MIVLLTGAVFAQAEADAALIACEPMYVAGILPEVDATGVPTDALVTVFLLGDCGAPAFYDVKVVDPDGNVLADERFDSPVVGDRLAVDPGELLPSTRYDVTVTPGDGWGEVTQSWFTTGSGPSPALDGTPGAEFELLEWSRREDMVWGSVAILPVPDPAGTSWLTIESTFGVVGGGGFSTNDDAAAAWIQGGATRSPGEICVTPIQVRVNGEEIAGDPVCQEPTRDAGPLSCSTAASPVGLWPLALLLFGRRRR